MEVVTLRIRTRVSQFWFPARSTPVIGILKGAAGAFYGCAHQRPSLSHEVQLHGVRTDNVNDYVRTLRHTYYNYTVIFIYYCFIKS